MNNYTLNLHFYNLIVQFLSPFLDKKSPLVTFLLYQIVP
nr:MAG TPA: hypothetical protein [Caudoviricetes sp.]